jgi:hypothetical protein
MAQRFQRWVKSGPTKTSPRGTTDPPDPDTVRDALEGKRKNADGI